MTEQERKGFEAAAKPLMQWMADHVHPHHTSIVTAVSAELLEGKCTTGRTLDYISSTPLADSELQLDSQRAGE